MKMYESPNAEFIEFTSEMVMSASGCNCQIWQTTNQEVWVDTNGNGVEDEDDDYVWAEGCSGRSAHASENPAGIAAPSWGL